MLSPKKKKKVRYDKSVLLTKIIHRRRKQSTTMSKHCQIFFWITKYVEIKEGFSSINEVNNVIVMSQRRRWRLMSQATNTKENEKPLSN